MQELGERISEALAKEEARAEQFASNIRIILLIVLTCVALLNARSLSYNTNVMNFAALVVCFSYGFIVFVRIRQRGYRPAMKYITSCVDIFLVFLLLFTYARIDAPSIALKSYVFIILFPLIALTAFRYDPKLTWTAGGLAIGLYVVLIILLTLSHSITLTHGGRDRELLTEEVTYVGQLTKVLILSGYVLLMSYLGQYSRRLFAKLITDEIHVRNQNELIDWELKIASQVQTQFLPNSFPEVAGLDIYGTVQQGRFVGGDYFDFIKLADDTLLIVVADVSGKGVPAALIMAEVRASTQLLASMQIDLEQFARQLNTLVHQSTDKKSFVTFCAVEVDTSKRVLTYVNAGHPPPLIYFEGNVRSLTRGTIPLGLRDSLPQLTKHVEDFPCGSLLVAYTDGLPEQTNILGEQFSDDRLQEYVRKESHLGAESFTLGLLEDVKNFGEGNSLNDDVSLAVVKFINNSLIH